MSKFDRFLVAQPRDIEGRGDDTDLLAGALVLPLGTMELGAVALEQRLGTLQGGA